MLQQVFTPLPLYLSLPLMSNVIGLQVQRRRFGDITGNDGRRLKAGIR